MKEDKEEVGGLLFFIFIFWLCVYGATISTYGFLWWQTIIFASVLSIRLGLLFTIGFKDK